MMSQRIGNMSDSTLIQVTEIIMGGIVTCVVIVALFTNFFDKR
jgi:hypothetical protein